MRSFEVTVDGKPYLVEQPSSSHKIFYVNRKKGTCCIARDSNNNWIVETENKSKSNGIPVEVLGKVIEEKLKMN